MLRFGKWNVGPALRTSKFKSWLRTQFPIAEACGTLHTEYQQSNGLRFNVSIIMQAGGPGIATSAAFPPRMSLDAVQQIRGCLGRAYQQRPRSNSPYLVVLVDSLSPPVIHYNMTEALFGRLYTSWISGTPNSSQNSRDTDGFFAPQNNRSLGAVGITRLPANYSTANAVLAIYHNPWTVCPIPANLLNKGQIVQLVRNPRDPNAAEFTTPDGKPIPLTFHT
jgi:hypothetical protein